MKLIQIANTLINLDKVITLDLNNNTLYLDGGKEIRLDQDDINVFVTQYNGVNTDELEKVIKQLTRVARLDPNLMSREGLIESITIMVRKNSLLKELKEVTKGVRLKELKTAKLVEVFQEIKNISEEFEKEIGF